METLRDGGVYQFSVTMRTPLAGHYVIARAAIDGYELFTVEEWGAMAPPRIRVDADGRVLYHGRTTGYRADILADTGQTVDR
jgi:hypothetical protein